MIINITKENYEEVVKNNEKKVIIDFWAPWCGPCRAIAPVLEEVISKDESVVVAKINVDDHQELAQEYEVRNIPTLVYLNKGEVKDKTVGLKSADDILSIVSKL
ncbi:MAG: thioredoxin [bacterium]